MLHGGARLLQSALITVVLAGCSQDPGGSIDRREAELPSEPAVNGWHPLQGDCASACTMQLALPKACVHPLAVVRFHAAHNPDGSINPVGTAEMFNSYAAFPLLQARLARDGAMLTTRLRSYMGRTLIADGVPTCPFGVRARSNVEN